MPAAPPGTAAYTQARLRSRVLAELSKGQQEAVDLFETAFGVDVLATDSPLRVVVQEAAMGHLYDHYRGAGLATLDAVYRAGEDVGLSPSAARSRYYRNRRAGEDAA